jgi:hypothetical protein
VAPADGKGDASPRKSEMQEKTLPPGIACDEPAPESVSFHCKGENITLPPKQPITMKVKLKIEVKAGDPPFVDFGTTLVFGDNFVGGASAAIPLQAPGNVGQDPVGGEQAGAGNDGIAAPIGPVCATLPVEQAEQPKPSEAGQISLLKTGVSCKDKRICEFTFAVKNTGNADFDGEVEFDDSITGDGAIFGATTIAPAPPAPWSCPKNGQGFKCTAKLKIPANGAAPPLNLSFDLGAGIGAVQNVENCATLKGAPAPSCATLPIEGPPPGPVQGPAKLTVTKTGPAECSDLGGCDFTIAIKNEGGTAVNGPIVVNEEVTLDGKAAPGALIVPNQTWTCTPGGTSTCTSIPAMIIGPGGTATLRAKVIFRDPTGAKVMQNCASVVGAAAKPCVSANLIQGPKLVLKKEKVDGVCDPVCTYRITATNVGNAKFPGPIKIVDFIGNAGNAVVSQDIVSARLIASQSKLSCTKPNSSISCEIDASLEPGMNQTIELTTVTNVTDFAANNCVLRTDIPQGTDNPMVCVPIVGKRAEGPNLAIEKRNFGTSKQGVDHCELKGECLFIIRVTNTGKSDFVGPIKITDTISLGAPELIQEGPGGNVGWNCTKAGAGGIGAASIDCTIPGAPSPIKPGTFGPLAPGKFIELGISVKPGKTWKDSNVLKNCAEFIDPPAGMGPIKSCASQKLDPFKLKIEKTGDQSCQPGGECTFDLNIFNDEQIIHDDPVTVVDNLSGLSSADIVSITPVGNAQPFPCKPAPTKVPFNCTGLMKLSPGDKNHYKIVIRLPADASAQSFSNCATVGGEGTEGGAEPSCHSVQLAPPDQPFSLKINKTGPATCEPGSECAFNLTLFNTGQREHKGTVTLTDGLSGVDTMRIMSISPALPCAEQPTDIPFNCKTGEDFTIPAGGSRTFRITARVPRSADTFTNCAIIAAGKAAGGGAGAADSSSSCVTVKSPDKAQKTTTPECQGGMVLMDEGLCACPPGTSWNGRNCIRPVAPAQPVCEGSRPIGIFPNCCPRGTHFERGACRPNDDDGDGGFNTTRPPPPPPPVCRGDRPIGKFPNCCPRGTHFERGACRPNSDNTGKGDGGSNTTKPPPPPVCEGARPIGKFPNCCPRGTHFERGACRPNKVDDGKDGGGGTNGTKPPPVCSGARPIGTFPNCCPRGTQFKRGACRPDKTDDGKNDGGSNTTTGPSCPAGTLGKPPNCRCPLGMTGRPPNCCPPGTRFEGGVCKRPPTTTPPDKTTTPTKRRECTGGKIGVWPNCRCPAGTTPFRGRCRTSATPTPTTPTCSGSTPRGTYPNCCSANNWNPQTSKCEKFQGPR